MAGDRSYVRNAADAQQVKQAARREQRTSNEFRGWLEKVLATYEGRALLWELLARAGVFRSVWTMTAEIHYRAGQQDFGHMIQAEIGAASEPLYLQMQTEAMARAHRSERETDAVHTPRAEQGDRPHGD